LYYLYIKIILGSCHSDIEFLSKYKQSVNFPIKDDKNNTLYNMKGFISENDYESFLELCFKEEHLTKIKQKKEEKEKKIINMWKLRKN